MRKYRILKKEYNKMLAELGEEKAFVSARLGEVQKMHERAMAHVEDERDKLKSRVAELERVLRSSESPAPGFTPEVVCRDEAVDRHIFGILPFMRFSAKKYEGNPYMPSHVDNYRFKLEVDRNAPPLERNQCVLLKDVFFSLLDYIYTHTHNPKGEN